MSAQAAGNDPQAIIMSLLERHSGNANAAPTRGARLHDDLGLDSLSMIELAVAAEDAFGIRIPDDDLERFRTVGDVIDYMRRAKPGD